MPFGVHSPGRAVDRGPPRRHGCAPFSTGKTQDASPLWPLVSRRFPVLMKTLVMKFGGTSVANLDRIRNVALHVKREVEAGYHVAVVVSAMSGKTNELVAWCKDAAPL